MVGSRNDDFGRGLFINDNGEETELAETTCKGCSSFKVEVIAICPAGKYLDISTSK